MDEAAAKTAQHLTFTIGGDEYGVSITEAREIIRYQAVTRVPAAPPWLRGVVNLRGSVVPVLDLRVRFGGEPCEATSRSCIVVLDTAGEDEAQQLGLLVDQVNQVTSFEGDALAGCPVFGLEGKRELLCGLGRQQDRFVLLLDVPRLLGEAGGAKAPPA